MPYRKRWNKTPTLQNVKQFKRENSNSSVIYVLSNKWKTYIKDWPTIRRLDQLDAEDINLTKKQAAIRSLVELWNMKISHLYDNNMGSLISRVASVRVAIAERIKKEWMYLTKTKCNWFKKVIQCFLYFTQGYLRFLPESFTGANW